MAQAPILTITLNPALDLAADTPQVRPGPKLRCSQPHADPGGGGINVSRALHQMGGSSQALVALGGATGARLQALLDAEGIATLPLAVPGETRESLSVTETATGAQYRFILPGPTWSSAQTDAARTAVAQALTPDTIAVLSGSMPPGVPAAFAGEVAAICRDRGAALIVDTSGGTLDALIARPAGPSVLRMDAHEAETLAGHPLPERIDTATFAEALRQRGIADTIIVARGRDGSTLAGPDGLWHASAPVDEVVSAVGAGDSFVAGYALALAKKRPPQEALRHGTAAAAACCLTPATHLCSGADVQAQLGRSILNRL